MLQRVISIAHLKKKLTGVYKNFTNDATKWGLENENKYETLFNKNVSTCGLIVNVEWSWLGYSPDGIVQEQKTIEIKCPLTFRDLDINECYHVKNLLWL